MSHFSEIDRETLRAVVAAILDDGASDSQLSQFHQWITSDLAIKPSKRSLNLAWVPVPLQQKSERLRHRLAMLHDPSNSARA